MLWDDATDLLARDAQDVAAIYIMAHRTIAIDPEGYMESAWRMVQAASGEAEIVSLYDVWCKLETAIEASDGSDTDLTAMCDVRRGIEDHIAAIPATTARGLAIKVDVGRNHRKGSMMEQSLSSDLALLTGNPVRPE